MKRKMYILKTWMYENPSLIAYIQDSPSNSEYPKNVPYITTSRVRAKKFYRKKEAIKYGKQYGGCHVDCVWYIRKKCRNGETLDFWE